MKRLITFILVGIILLTLCACSADNEYNSTDGDIIEATTIQEGSKESINLNKYITVEYSGYSGAGRASVKMDKEQFYLDNISIVRFKDENAKKAYYDLTKSTKSEMDIFFDLI